MSDDRLARLTTFIQQKVSKDARRAIEADTPLVSSGLVDSLSLIQVLAFVEDEFGVVIPDEAATARAMNTPQSILDLTRQYEH